MVEPDAYDDNPFNMDWLYKEIAEHTNLVEDESGESLIIKPLVKVVMRIIEFDKESIAENINWSAQVVLPKGMDDEEATGKRIEMETVKESVYEELIRVKKELKDVKQRFGLDKQEAFLKSNANITLKEFALMLNGRDCQPNLTPDELLLAKQRGFVVVYGDSDDRVEFKGAIREEGHTNPLAKDRPAGILALSETGELLDEDSDLYTAYVNGNRNIINVFYCSKDGLNWVFETDIPHETFLTYDGEYNEDYADFDDGFARCIVFEVLALR